MGNITLSHKRVVSGVVVTRKMVIHKNKYSKVYQEHKKNIDEKKDYTIGKYGNKM